MNMAKFNSCVVISVELRKVLAIKEKDPIEIFLSRPKS
jgi:hypothetical protein